MELYDIEAERAVIGSMLIDKEALNLGMLNLTENDFYINENKIIYKAILTLYKRFEAVDMITVKTELQKNQNFEIIGGLEYLVGLTDRIPTTANIEEYIKIVKERAILRELAKVIDLENMKNKKIEDVLDELENKIIEVRKRIYPKDYTAIKDILKETISNLNKEEEEGIKTGFEDLDYMLKGLHNSDLIVISARPAMGKTSLAVNIGTNIAKQNINVAMFSLEESKEKYIQRILSMQTMIDINKIRTAKLEEEDWHRLDEAVNELANIGIFIDNTPALEIENLRSRCIKLKQEQEIGLIVIDYLQLIKGTQNEICFALKEIAKELNIPIIAISQLSRKTEERFDRGEDSRPILTDINDDIIHYADVLMFLYREEYYYLETKNRNVSEIIIRTNKNEYRSTVELKTNLQYCKFENIEDNKEG